MDWSSPSPEQICAAEEQTPAKIPDHMTDLCRDEEDSSPPLQLHTLKQFEQHLNDLKKENFSLKLRIYFLEERIQQKYEESSEDVYRTNIELKVEVESLKQELQEKQQLLDKALTTAESLTNHNEAELQRRCQERQQEIDHMQQVLETKIQLLQEEAQLARSEAERMASLAGSHSHTSLMSLDTPMEELPQDRTPLNILSSPTTNKDRFIEELTKELHSKEALITELSGEKSVLTLRVGELEGQVQELSSSLVQKEKDVEFYQEELSHERLRIEQEMQSLVEEQQSQLNQYECAASQCVSELQKAQLQVQSLQAKIHESEANNMKLQEKLDEMECELRSLRQASHSQERTIQDLTESSSTKDSEAQELYQLIEGQNTTLCKLKEIVHRNQLANCKSPEGVSQALTLSRVQGELVGAQSSLFSLGLELEGSQRSLRQSQRQQEDHIRFKDRLNCDLQEALQHKEVTEKHNQDLQRALQKTRTDLQAKEGAMKECEADKYNVVQEKERTIAQLEHSLKDKQRQLKEYSEMLASTGQSKTRDALLEKLKERIKDRDRALERAVDDKFCCLEEREDQVRRLQVALREKERDLERLRCILSNSEETITSLDALTRSKERELEQAAEAYRNLQFVKEQNEEKERNSLREKDAIISQLQAALQRNRQETKDLTATLIARVQVGPSEVVEELRARLALKEKLFQELLSDRSCQANEHQVQIQDLLNTLTSKDQYLQDFSYRLSQVISERTSQVQELRKQLSLKERELCELKRDKEMEVGGDAEHLRNLLKQKEGLFKELMQNQEEPMESSSKESEAEIQTLREELQLMLRKEKEMQVELSTLRSCLTRQQARGDSSKESTDQQCVLEELVAEYYKLIEALRAEKRLYQNLTHIHSQSDSSSEKIQSLHTELDSVQALRTQLEEVLSRTRSMSLIVEKAAKRQPDFGDVSTDEEEGDDEGGSSEEFTDSIEEEDEEGEDNVAVSCLAHIQKSGKTYGCVQEGSAILTQQANGERHIEPLQEAKKTVEGELGPIRSQLERDGYASVAQMRRVFQRLQQENNDLKERPADLHTKANHCNLNREEVEEQEDTEEEEEEEEKAAPLQAGKRGPPSVRLSDEPGKRHCTRPSSLDLSSVAAHRYRHHAELEEEEEETGRSSSDVGELWRTRGEGLCEQTARLRSDLALSHQENRELQERLMVSEATVHAQAEQLKDYRDLLTETSVQQASKQVQVDLQDLGYETCGRSENEAEREDTSSPEFDDLEMCTSLSQQHHSEVAGSGWCSGGSRRPRGAYEMDDESASLQHVVQDLRSQLSGCHKVIRGLQLRVRSLSATSDYASSLERTPRKVNWAFETPPNPSAVEDDEGWMSDSQGFHFGSKPSRELQELMTRVASLEAQLKSSRLEDKNQTQEGKCATWPGKYNSLIQAQARDLSHLRQKMREGQRICHILTQHLADTTKAFEELLRANDIDYYMGQSFREQLAQSTALAQRVGTKISGRDRAESYDDHAGHELLALRLSKELQHKDKIIESLQTKLQQRSETPSSCQALSETTDQSDRTSLVSDEYRTNEDVELVSDVEYQEQQSGRVSRRDGMTKEFTIPQGTAALTRSGGTPNQHDLPNYSQLSHHAFQQYQLGGGLEGHSLKSDSGITTGVNLIEEHLQEVRCLRQRLEESIRTNECLRQQLEKRLSNTDGGSPTNIYIQGLDTVNQLSNEIRVLKEQNLGLQSRLQASTDTREELLQLRESVFTAHTRLKQAELEAQQWKEELRRIQAHSQEQEQQILALRQERQAGQETSNRLQHQSSLLQQQLCESREFIHSLQSELQVYDRFCSNTKASKGYLSNLPGLPVELGELLEEVRSLRAQLQNSVQENSALKQLELHKQLEQKLGVVCPRTPTLSTLTASPQRDNFYRRQLLHDPAPSPPVRDIGLFNCGSPGPPYSDLEDNHSTANETLDPHSELEGEAPDGSFANRNGRHTIGHVDDFTALQQQVLEGRGLVQRMETTLQACLGPTPLEERQKQSSNLVLDYGCVKSLLSNTRTLRQILDEAMALLKMFWRAALPSSDHCVQNVKKEQCMQEEILSLKLRVSEQEEVIKGTIQRLRSTSRTKENMEHFIVNQLSRTRDVLKKARANLEKNELRLSSLSPSSSSPYTAADTGGAVRDPITDHSSLKTSISPGVAVATSHQRVAARKRSSQCLL